MGKGGESVEDERIVELFNRRDELAIAAAEEKYGAYCRSIAQNLLGTSEDAAECVNDALHAVWRAIPPEKPRSLKTYMGRVVRNLSVSRWREQHAKKRFDGMELLLSELSDCVPSPLNVEEAVEQRRLSELISAWLDTLGEVDRALFVRRYWYGEGVSELARERGCTPPQLTQRMLRLRRALRAFLESEGAEI